MDHSVTDAAADDSRAGVISRLVEEHYELIYRFAYRLSGSQADAEDLTQQAFLTAQQKLEQLRDAGKARSWLLTIVRNSYLRSRRRQEVVTELPFEERIDEQASSLDTAIDEEALQRAVQQLPEDYRLPLILFYFNEMSYQEIAQHLDIPVGTVMSRLSRGKGYLRRQLISAAQPDTISKT